MRLIFLGSGEFGLPTLQALAQNHEVAAVVSQPDRPAGRKRQLTPTPIAQWAQDQGMAVLKSENVNERAFIEQVRALQARAGVVIAFGQKLSPELIDALGDLAVNLHASLLPRYRGAAPINWAIIEGEEETGLSVISLAQRMDAGLIYGQAATSIDPLETAGELHDRLAAMGPGLILEVLEAFEAGTLQGQPQNESEASRAPKLSKADATVDFTQSAMQVRQRIHGLTPWPGVKVTWARQATGKAEPLTLLRVKDHPEATTEAAPGTVLEGHRVATGQGVIELLELQTPGKKAIAVEEFVRGRPLAAGDQLGQGVH